MTQAAETGARAGASGSIPDRNLALGWYLAFVGSLAIAIGGAIRASTTERRRKPPGVL